MGLLSFLKRSPGGPEKSPSRRPAVVTEPADVERARTRARQRLIGATVLVAVGVIGFPLLFDRQPRPLPVDIPIEIPSKDKAPALPLPKPARTAVTPQAAAPKATEASGTVLTETAADAGREVSAPASAALAPHAAKAADKPAEKPVAAAAPPVDKPSEKKAAEKAPESKPPKEVVRQAAKDGARAQALLEGQESAAPAANGRFVVQVGAFGEVAAAREVRQKVEKLGLKTYTQVVETSAGKRIRVRVGPFNEREEAEKAVAKLRQAGMSPALLTL